MYRRIFLFLLLVSSTLVFAQQEPSPAQREIQKMVMAKAYIEAFYVDTVNSGRLTEEAIRGMLKSLDPHSLYSNAEETRKLNEPLNGNFDGIGVSFNVLEDTLVVLSTVPGGPSERMGVLPGDRIVRCNDTVMAGVKMNRDSMMRLLRGPRGTLARLGIRRGADTTLVYFDVIRDKIPLNTVDASYIIRPSVGYIRLSSFGAKSADEVGSAIDSLKHLGMKSLILDLQQNGGGYMSAAQGVAGLFLKNGDMVVYTKGRGVQSEELHAERTDKDRHFDGRLIVLVDEYSASAAEIVSGAVQDHDRGTIVGRRTFGKGLVQRPCYLPDGSMMRLTIAHYYTPTGRCIQKPYEKGHQEDYAKDIANRLKSGELTCRDSIHFADSLCFKTLKEGRTVYGGGGIMPDIFVPLDTTKYNAYHRALSAKNCLLTATLRFVDRHREQLHSAYKDVVQFASYEVEPEMWQTLDEEAAKAKITATDEERAEARPHLAHQIKSLIARDLWDMSSYFQMWNEQSDIVQAALDFLNK